MTGIAERKRQWEQEAIEAERKLIAEWLRKNNKSGFLAIICSAIAKEIERGEYRTKEKQNEQS